MHNIIMNFRPTKLKVILGVVFSALVWIIVFTTFRDFMNKFPQFLIQYFGMYDFVNFFAGGNFILFGIQFVVFYIIFSLIQMRRVVRN